MEAVGGMEPEGAPAPGQFFQDHQQMVFSRQQQGVVVEGGVRQAQSVLPVNQFRRRRQGVTPPVSRLELPGGAVSAIQGAAPGGKDGDKGRVVQEVQGRIGPGVQIFTVWKNRLRRRKTGDLLQDTQNDRFSRPGNHPVGAAVFLGVFRAQGGVDPSQDDGNARGSAPGPD